jgi:subtilisin family serine protease
MSAARGRTSWLASVLCALPLLGGALPSVAADGTMRGLIIRGPKPYDSLVATVRDLGGEVTQQYENVDAIAASVPEGRLAELAALLGPGKISKDAMVAQPHGVARPERHRTSGAEVEAQAGEPRLLSEQELAALPTDYTFNNGLIGASALHAQGLYGQGMTVAIIDSGTANSSAVPTLGGRVVGGESFVPGDPVASATSRFNGHHGTWVGTVIAGNVQWGYYNTSPFVVALKKYAPTAISGACPDPPGTSPTAVCWVPQLGVAPLAKLYALKVFDSRGGGAPESRIIAAMDRAITLRRNYNGGAPSVPVAGSGTEDDPYVYDSLNLQVVNMSLGGGTLFAGRDLEDQLTVKMLKEGIVLASSAGNDGFGAMTVGSPGSGLGSITVGASSDPVHERIWAEAFYGIGDLYRPTTHVQTADFSSRGPNADGRFDPDVVANGVATWAQGTCNGLTSCTYGSNYFVWGTSFSAPTVAGAVALLRQAYPQAKPDEIREAILRGANPHLLGDRSGRIDQGYGHLDVAASAARLDDCVHGRRHREDRYPRPSPFVEQNIGRIGFEPVRLCGETFTTRVRGLVPGQVKQFFVESDPFTEKITVDLTNIRRSLPPSQQNALYGDDVFFKVVDAPTSFQDRNITDFAKVDTRYVLENPQTGLVRVSLQGDYTNAGEVSADLRIHRERKPGGRPSAIGAVRQGDILVFETEVPSGARQAVFEAQWVRNWSMYPTSDIDMLLVDPDGEVDLTGATLASPERAVVADPKPGVWTVVLSAYAVPAESDFFSLVVQADGKRLKVTR